MSNPFIMAFTAFAFSVGVVHAHEFWIEPLEFTIQEGEPSAAHLRVGQAFEGSPYAYIPQNFRLFEVAHGDVRRPVEGRIGDRPAFSVEALDQGLNVILHVTRDYDLTWDGWDVFVDFVVHKDAPWVLEQHEKQDWPKEAVREIYSRYAKSLIAVGQGAGQDRQYGLLTEIVALANPYTDDLSDGLPVQVFYQGEPRPGAQFEVFAKDSSGEVTITRYLADDAGQAQIPVQSGVSYMIDSVQFRLADPALMTAQRADVEGRDLPLWETLWASLTFQVP